ncbi:MAG: DUF763 domain-containing protein [Candidatus Aminicenantia bacterium]
MKRVGVANLPLHYGKAPSWLFEKMVSLSRNIISWIYIEESPQFFIERISDPFWFQSLGCVLGFDWHSSGLTTTLCGALKEAVKRINWEFGIFVAGGKGKFARKTPEEIKIFAEKRGFNPEPLIYASRISAKIDSSAVQDGYSLYHHSFIFTNDGTWCVIQQGMNEESKMARRYHWLSVKIKDYVNEPHNAVCCNERRNVLNMVAEESGKARNTITLMTRENPEKLISEIKKIRELNLSEEHSVDINFVDLKRLSSIFKKIYENAPENFEKLLLVEGVGPKTVRALALISDLVYGAKPSFKDPATFSFAHGGKDGHPFPVERETYEKSIKIVERAIKHAKIGDYEKLRALRRLYHFFSL